MMGRQAIVHCVRIGHCLSSVGHGASDGKQLPHDYKIKATEHLQTNDRPNIQTYALCTFTFSLQTFTIFFLINAFINVYYNLFDVYHIYAQDCIGEKRQSS